MPLLWISLSFILGLILGEYLPWVSAGWLTLALVSLLLWPILRRVPLPACQWLSRAEPRLLAPPVLLVACFFFGALRMQLSGPDVKSGHVAAINDQGAYQIQGIISAPPDRRDGSTQIRLAVQQVAALDSENRPGIVQRSHGTLLIMFPGSVEWQYGDRLSLEGKPVTPPEDESFSYRDYLARQDIYTYLTYPTHVRLLDRSVENPVLSALYRFRDLAYAEINHLYPAPEAPLLAGILLGNDNDLPEPLADAFRDTGTAHVIAISGFNIAILSSLFYKLFERIFLRWWATLLAIVAISFYTILVGATPSVVRAAIMGALSLVGMQIGRSSAGMNTLLIAAGAMSLRNPHLLWDASFQLSFGATAGLMLLGDPFTHGFQSFIERFISNDMAKRITGPVSEYVLLTLAAQVMTLPIILYTFGRLSLSALLANPLILPPQPAVMVFSGIAVLAGLVSDPLGHLLAWLAWPFTAYTIRMVELLGTIPGGVLVIGEMGVSTVLLMYAAIFAARWSKQLPGAVRTLVTPSLLLTGLGLVVILLWRAAAAAPDGKLHLTLFNVSGSPVLLVRAPSGETVLVNTGPSSRYLNDALGRWLSPFDRQIDGLLVNSAQSTEIENAGSLLERYPPAEVWWGIKTPQTRAAKRLYSAFHTQRIPEHALAPGESLAIDAQARLEVRAVSDTGSALLLTFQNFRVLVPGGIPLNQLPAGDRQGPFSLLLLDRRDLQTAPPEDWLALQPQGILAVPGEQAILPDFANWINNRPGGWLSVVTDGKQMWIEQK